jgi:hypothetical protein
MTYVVQPYLYWKGHYKQYFENLLEHENTKYIYCEEKDLKYKNSIFIQNVKFDYQNSFMGFILSRIINSVKVIYKLNKTVQSNETIYFLEFEPFSSLYFCLKNRNKKLTIIQTIHSVERIKYKNKIKNLISIIQRGIYRIAINEINKFNTIFIVHYKYHKIKLNQLGKNSLDIQIIDYPAPDIKVSNIKKLSDKKSLLIFGLVREDKGIYNFLKNIEHLDLNITIAGKIIDSRVKEFKNKFHIIDKFLSILEIDDLFEKHDFALIPYGEDYTGGAGPLKDSFAYATPVITSNNKIFSDLVIENNVGKVYDQEVDIINILCSMSEKEYMLMSENCIKLAKKTSWGSMRKKYWELLK